MSNETYYPPTRPWYESTSGVVEAINKLTLIQGILILLAVIIVSLFIFVCALSCNERREPNRHELNEQQMTEIHARIPIETNPCSAPLCGRNEASFPVVVDCSHTFCGECIIRHWKRTIGVHKPCPCPVPECNRKFYKIITISWPVNKDRKEIDVYNTRFAPDLTLRKIFSDSFVLIFDMIKTTFDRPTDQGFFKHIGLIFIYFWIRVYKVAIFVLDRMADCCRCCWGNEPEMI